MFCTNCGQIIDDDSDFCMNCGADLRAAKELSAEPEPSNEFNLPDSAFEASETTLITPVAGAPAVGEADETMLLQPTPLPGNDSDATVLLQPQPAFDPAPAQVAAPTQAAVPDQAPAPVSTPAPKKKGKGKVVALVIILVAVVAAAVVGVIFFMQNQEKEKEEAWLNGLAQQEYPVAVKITADGYDADAATPVPIHVTGTDFAGEHVSLDLLADGSTSPVCQLARGEYTLSVLASPITKEGVLFNYSSDPVAFQVVDTSVEKQIAEAQADGETAAEDEAADAKDEAADAKDEAAQEADGVIIDDADDSFAITISLEPIAVLDTTEEQISASRDALEECGYDEDDAKTYANLATKAHEKAVEDKKASDRNKALEEYQSRLNSLISNMDYLASNERSKISSTPWKSYEIITFTNDWRADLAELQQLMSDVLGYLRTTLSDSQVAALDADQTNWDSRYASEYEDFERYLKSTRDLANDSNYVRICNGHVDAYCEITDLQEERIQQLINKI